MRSIAKVLSALSLAAAGSANAALIQFSYTWDTATLVGGGSVLSGTVEGTVGPDGNTVTNLSNLRATHSRQPSVVFDSVYVGQPYGTFTLDGSFMRFLGFESPFGTAYWDWGFGLMSDEYQLTAVVGNFFDSGAGVPIFPCSKCHTAYEYTYSASRWSASVVPEPSALSLLGVGLAVLGAVRARRAHSALRRRSVARRHLGRSNTALVSTTP